MDNILEYYEINSDYCERNGWHTYTIFQKVKFETARSFMRVSDGKRVVVSKGTAGYITANYTLLFGNEEVYATDDMLISDHNPNLVGLHSYIFKVLEENNVFDKNNACEKLNVSYWTRKALEQLHLD